MTNPFDAIASPVRAVHRQAGHEGTLQNFAPSTSAAKDWYDETDTSEFDPLDPEPVTIRVERGEQARSRFTAGGVEVEADVVVLIDPTEATEIVESGADRPASEIVDPAGPTDTRYRVVRVDDDGSGLYLVQCERLDE